MSFQKQCFDYVDIPQPSLWAGLIETTSAKKKRNSPIPRNYVYIAHLYTSWFTSSAGAQSVCPLLGKIEMKAVEL